MSCPTRYYDIWIIISIISVFSSSTLLVQCPTQLHGSVEPNCTAMSNPIARQCQTQLHCNLKPNCTAVLNPIELCPTQLHGRAPRSPGTACWRSLASVLNSHGWEILKYWNMETLKTLKHGNWGEKHYPGGALSFQLRLRLQDLQVTKGDARPDPEGIPRAAGDSSINNNLLVTFKNAADVLLMRFRPSTMNSNKR